MLNGLSTGLMFTAAVAAFFSHWQSAAGLALMAATAFIAWTYWKETEV
jgi:hypothetical protein